MSGSEEDYEENVCVDILSDTETNDLLLDPNFTPPPPPPPPPITPRKRTIIRELTPEIINSANIPPPLVLPPMSKHLSKSTNQSRAPTPPPRRSRPISTPPGSYTTLHQKPLQNETQEVISFRNESDPIIKKRPIPPPRKLPTIAKQSTLPNPLTPRTISSLEEIVESTTSPEPPVLSPRSAEHLVPKTPQVEKIQNRKSLPVGFHSRIRSSSPASFELGPLSPKKESTSPRSPKGLGDLMGTETKVIKVYIPPPPPPPRPPRSVMKPEKSTKVSFVDPESPELRGESTPTLKPQIPLLNIGKAPLECPPSPPEPKIVAKPFRKPCLNHTLSSPDLRRKKKPETMPSLSSDMDDIGKDSEEEENDGPMMAIRTGTYSNVNWEDLESQIMESPVEEVLLSARGNRSKERWCQYMGGEAANQSMESERMRRFAFGSQYDQMASSGTNYETICSLVEEQRNAITARGSPSTVKRKLVSKERTEQPNSPSSRRRSSSSAGFSKIFHPEKDKIEKDKPEKDKDKEKKKKKKFLKLIKGNKNDISLDTGVSEVDYAEEGKKKIALLREQSLDLSFGEFIEQMKRTSTLPTTLKNSNIDRLYFEDFEADDVNTVETATDDSSNLIYATLFKLIQRLTVSDAKIAILRSVFLLTYRSFVTPKELLELFICRAFGTPPTSDTEACEKWKPHQVTIQTRVLIVLGTWVAEYFHSDFANDETLYLLSHFIHFMSQNPKSVPFLTLVYCGIGQHVSPQDELMNVPGKKNKFPKPHLPKISNVMKLLHFNPTEVARQLALMDKSLFDKISPGEYAHQGWTRDDKLTRSGNIVAMINQFNNICNWAASEVLRESNLKERAVILHRLIIIAEESRALCNFNAVMAIISGLQSAPIYRLRDTWDLLPSKTWDIWDELNELMSNKNNFATYRTALSAATETKTPCVPYIGIYLTDLVFVEDGNKDFKENTNLINVKKLEFTSGVLFRLEKCKPSKYRLKPVWSLQGYILSSEKFTEEQQKDISLKLQGIG